MKEQIPLGRESGNRVEQTDELCKHQWGILCQFVYIRPVALSLVGRTLDDPVHLYRNE